MNALTFEQDFTEIPFQDMDGADYIVCLDSQDRLGRKTWSVVEVLDGEYVDALGLFWCKANAELFAESLCSKD